jgi:hypothetical protein
VQVPCDEGLAIHIGPERANNAKSKIRSRVEHVFAEQKDRMGLFIRTEDEDRTGEPRLQYQTPALLAAHCGGMIDRCLRQGL